MVVLNSSVLINAMFMFLKLKRLNFIVICSKMEYYCLANHNKSFLYVYF